MKHGKYPYLLLLLAMLFACNKAYKEEIKIRNEDTGIIGTDYGSNDIGGMRGQLITLFAKIGDHSDSPQIYIGNALATVVSRGQKQLTYRLSNFSDETRTVTADTFRVLIPEEAEIGGTNIYIKIAGAKCPPLPFIVRKPDILYPGKVLLSPYISTNWADWGRHQEIKDGPLDVASLGFIQDMGLDKEGNIYFIDNGRVSWENGSPDIITMCLRKIANGTITTLGGNGENEFSTQLKDLKLKSISCMKIAPDGSIYLAVLSPVKLSITPVGETDPIDYETTVPRLLKINPVTGEIKKVLESPYDIISDELSYSLSVIADGPANKAMIGEISDMELDKEGNIYFIDRGRSNGGGILRKLSVDGMVTTLSAFPSDYGDHTFRNMDGTHPVTIKAGSTPYENTSDGFGAEVRLNNPKGIVMAGNGKFYIAQGPSPEMGDCIREFNPLTKEVSTIVGKPVNAKNNFQYSGTFKEVDMRGVSSFDADFDGNVLVSYGPDFSSSEPATIYKMDINKEMIYKLAGARYPFAGDPNKPQPGDSASLTTVSRIVFDQFGKLYVGYSRADVAPVFISTLTIDRK